MVIIRFVPHSQQRYDTIGDWHFTEDGNPLITVSRLGNEDYEFLIAIHELIEAYLCNKAGISERTVTEFDENWNKTQYHDETEPGDNYFAPYYKEHQYATAIEKLLADKLGVDWRKYEETIEEVSRTYESNR